MSSRGLCPASRRSSLEVVDGGQLPDGGFSLRRPYIRISGRELHMCASRPTRDAKVSRCAAMIKPCSRGWGMRGARTRDGLLAQVPPSIVMSRSSGIALSDSRADLPRTTMLMPAHLRGAKQGDGLTGRQWRREWAKDGAKPPSPADRSTRPLEPIHENPILPCAQPLTGGAQCARAIWPACRDVWRRTRIFRRQNMENFALGGRL